MAEALERLVNLAMYLASARAPVTWEQVRAHVDGYPAHQDQAAFLRMFERDKEDLREAGLVIESDADGAYRLDAAATFASEISLSAAETATVRAVGAAFLDDESFPFSDDLRIALAKVATSVQADHAPVVSRLAEEQPGRQGASVALLDRAILARKRVEFRYVNAAGERKRHSVEPFGLFLRDGRWYLVGRDRDLDKVRLYAVLRIQSIQANRVRPKSPDFDRPTDFDVRSFIALPFQYGRDPFEASVRFEPAHAWRTRTLTTGSGTLDEADDGSIEWTIAARDPERLMRWVVENGPGLTLISPTGLVRELRERCAQVAARHG